MIFKYFYYKLVSFAKAKTWNILQIVLSCKVLLSLCRIRYSPKTAMITKIFGRTNFILE